MEGADGSPGVTERHSVRLGSLSLDRGARKHRRQELDEVPR